MVHILLMSNQDEFVPPPASSSSYVRRKPPSQDCAAEGMITIEPVSLRRGSWRHSDGYLNSLRRLDPQIAVVIFYGVLTAMMFYLYWNKYKSIAMASLYTTSSLVILAVSLATVFGIDFLGAMGGAVLPN